MPSHSPKQVVGGPMMGTSPTHLPLHGTPSPFVTHVPLQSPWHLPATFACASHFETSHPATHEDTHVKRAAGSVVQTGANFSSAQAGAPGGGSVGSFFTTASRRAAIG